MKALKILGIGFGSILIALLAVLIIIGSIAPETYIYLGRQIPKRYVDEIRTLKLVDNDEQIKYFYSDAIFDIKAGMYFVTNKHLVVYSDKWEEPETIIPFGQIVSLDVQYDDSFLTDTFVSIATRSGLEVSFPISSEKGRDKKFISFIKEKTNSIEAPNPKSF